MKANHNPELSLKVLKKFRTIFGSVRQHFREVEQTCGISGAQLWILQEINKQPSIGVSELSNRLSIHQSTASLMVEKMVNKGLIRKERSKQDQRRVGLCITDDALEILKKAPGPAEGILPEALLSLPEPTLQQLDSALQAVIEQLTVRDDELANKPLSDL